MKAPTEAQLNDPKWWDESAPSGCEKIGVAYIDGKVWSYEFMMPGVTAMTSPCNAEVRFFHRPKEPTKKERLAQHLAERDAFLAERASSPEWDGFGWPTLKSQCWFKDYSEEPEKRWKHCVFLGVSENNAVWLFLLDQGEYYTETNVSPDQFRCMGSFAREEAIDAAKSVIKDALIVNQLDDDTERGLEALYDAGMLRKAGGE